MITIKMSMGAIVQLSAYCDYLETQQLPTLRQRRNLIYFKKALQTEKEVFEKHLKLISEDYLVKNEKGELEPDKDGNVKIIPEKIPEFSKVMSDLQAETTDVSFEEFKLPEKMFDKIVANEEVVNILYEHFIEEDAQSEK